MDEARRFKIDKTKSQDSRYKNLDRIVYEDGTEIIESQERVIKKSLNDKYHEVGPGGRREGFRFNIHISTINPFILVVYSNSFRHRGPLTVKAGQNKNSQLSTLTSLKGYYDE